MIGLPKTGDAFQHFSTMMSDRLAPVGNAVNRPSGYSVDAI
jgi:hypothetical protein